MNPIRKIKDRLNARKHAEILKRDFKYQIRVNYLTDRMLHETESGIASERYADAEVIVSLTTYGKRLFDVALTIESIMQGSMKPNRIVLWLGNELKETPLPIALQRQRKRGLQVEYCKDIRSHTKLIPSLRKYPEAIIITIDDDCLYDYDVVEKLVNTHREHPKHIIANRIHRIVLGKDNKPLGYMSWEGSASPTDDSPLNFFTGVGGVLYPPHALHPEVLNEEVFLDICPYADDVWFFAMALKAGTRTLKCYTHNVRGDDYLLNQEMQDVGLFHINTSHNKEVPCGNDVQLQAVFNRYELWGCLLEQ